MYLQSYFRRWQLLSAAAPLLLTSCSAQEQQRQPAAPDRHPAPAAAPARPAARVTARWAGPDSIYAGVAQLPTLVGGGSIRPVVEETMRQQFIVPDSIPVPRQLELWLLVGKTGRVENVEVRAGTGDENTDKGLAYQLLAELPRFEPGRHRGRPVRVEQTLALPLTGANTPLRLSEARRREAQARQTGVVRRQAGETDAAFMHRVMPLSAGGRKNLVTYPWRPGPYGRQLFFSTRGGAGNDYGTDLYVIDPYAPGTYAVQILPLPSMGDLTDLEALFFTDVDHDGQKELLALMECSLREDFVGDDGEVLQGRAPHYQTLIFQLAGSGKDGRPQYREDSTLRPYLDELSTAAEVRAVLAQLPPPKPAAPAAGKRAGK